MNGEISLTTGDLLTVSGASAAAIVVASFLKQLFGLADQWVRSLSMLTGLIVVVGATVLSTEGTGILSLFLAMIVGMNAGMGAAAFFDAGRSGLGYQTLAKPKILVEETSLVEGDVRIVDENGEET